MFNNEEIKEMLEEAESTKAHAQVNIGDFCWFKNHEYDENDVSGKSYPFFVGRVVGLEDDGEKVDLKIAKEKFP